MASLSRELTPIVALNATTSWTSFRAMPASGSCRRKATLMPGSRMRITTTSSAGAAHKLQPWSCGRELMMGSVLGLHSSLLSNSHMRGLFTYALINGNWPKGVRRAKFSHPPEESEEEGENDSDGYRGFNDEVPMKGRSWWEGSSGSFTDSTLNSFSVFTNLGDSNQSSFSGAEATAGEEESGFKTFSMVVTLVRHKESKRVVYLECGVRFVEFLLNFLLVPVGTAAVRNKLPAPCLDNLYRSADGLDESLLPKWDKKGKKKFIYGGLDKDTLLAPPFPAIAMSSGMTSGEVFQGLPALLGVKTSFACHWSADVPRSTTFVVSDSLQIHIATSNVIMQLLSRASERIQDLEIVQVCVQDLQAKTLFERAFTSDTVLNDVFGPH